MPIAGSLSPFTGSSPSGLVPEATDPGAGNSLTRFLRSTNNRQGQLAENATGAGGALLQSGAGLTDRGVDTFQKPLDYWSALLSGDKTAMGNAIGPQLATVNKQYDNANRAASTLMPRGGYRSAIQAELPQEKAGVVSNAILGLQPQAAQQVSGIAALLSGLGLDVSKLGLSEQGLGQGYYGQLLQSLLGGRGQDVAEHGQSMQLAGTLANSVSHGIKPR